MTIITESILQFNETCINRISTYIMSYLKPTLGEKIYDPCMYNGECIVAAIKYMNYNHDYNINWKKMKDYINGTSDDYTFINNARNNILNATYEFRDDLYAYTHSNNYNFNNTLQYIYNINSNEKYDIIVSRIYSYNIHLMNLIFNSMKNNCRCAIIVDDIFLFVENEKYKNIRKKMINTMNVTEIVSIGNSESIIFFDNKCITSNVSFYNLDNNIETYESNLSYKYISLNNYELFDDNDMPSLVSYNDMPSLVSYTDMPSLDSYIDMTSLDSYIDMTSLVSYNDMTSLDSYTDMPSLDSYTDMPSLVSYTDMSSLDNYTDMTSLDNYTDMTSLDNYIDIIENNKVLPESLTQSDKVLPESLTQSDKVLPESLTQSDKVLPESLTQSDKVLPESLTQSDKVLPESTIPKNWEFLQQPFEIVNNNISTIVEKRKDAIIIGNNVVIVSFDGGMVHIMSEKAFIREKGHKAIENIQRKTFRSNQEDEYIAFEIYTGRIKINTILEMI